MHVNLFSKEQDHESEVKITPSPVEDTSYSVSLPSHTFRTGTSANRSYALVHRLSLCHMRICILITRYAEVY